MNDVYNTLLKKSGNKPIFKITGKDSGKVYKIYLNGNVEGFDEDVAIFNQIPSIMGNDAEIRVRQIFVDALTNLGKTMENFGYKPEYFYSVNENTISEVSSSHSVLESPNFSIASVQSSSAKEDK